MRAVSEGVGGQRDGRKQGEFLITVKTLRRDNIELQFFAPSLFKYDSEGQRGHRRGEDKNLKENMSTGRISENKAILR